MSTKELLTKIPILTEEEYFPSINHTLKGYESHCRDDKNAHLRKNDMYYNLKFYDIYNYKDLKIILGYPGFLPILRMKMIWLEYILFRKKRYHSYLMFSF